MDILNPGLLGSREWFNRAFAQPIEVEKDEEALERLRAIVRPFILRRAKDEPEVELDLPPITVEKDYCRLTVEQASLYQATVDRWLPADRGARGPVRPPRRGARDARAPEAGVQPPGDADAHRARRSTAARASSSGWSSCSQAMPADDKALVFTQYPSFDRLVPYLAERLGRKRRLLPRPPERAPARGAADRVRDARTGGRRCS